MRELFFLFMAFLHDLATGFWLASFLLYLATIHEGLALASLVDFFPDFLVFSLFVILLTGIPRWLEVRSTPLSEIKRKFLLLKHALLIPLLLGGTLWVWLR